MVAHLPKLLLRPQLQATVLRLRLVLVEGEVSLQPRVTTMRSGSLWLADMICCMSYTASVVPMPARAYLAWTGHGIKIISVAGAFKVGGTLVASLGIIHRPPPTPLAATVTPKPPPSHPTCCHNTTTTTIVEAVTLAPAISLDRVSSNLFHTPSKLPHAST